MRAPRRSGARGHPVDGPVRPAAPTALNTPVGRLSTVMPWRVTSAAREAGSVATALTDRSGTDYPLKRVVSAHLSVCNTHLRAG